MEEYEESLEQLEEKIVEYEKQLLLVRNEIKKYERAGEQENPEANEQVVNLKKLEYDMIEVINLTRDLINYKKKNDETNVDTGEIYRDKELSTSTVRRDSSESKKLVGRTCSFFYENKKIYGIIENIVLEKNIEQLLINIIGTNEKVILPKNYIQLNEILSESSLTENNQFQALYQKDGQWYDCTIGEKTDDMFFVTYIGYNNSEYVKHDQIRIKKKKKIKEIVTPAGYKIPENLIVKENDSLKVKMKKQKKRIALKKKQKSEILNQELNNKAQQWRSFHKKTISKNKHFLAIHKRVEGEEKTEAKISLSNAYNIRRKFDADESDD